MLAQRSAVHMPEISLNILHSEYIFAGTGLSEGTGGRTPL